MKRQLTRQELLASTDETIDAIETELDGDYGLQYDLEALACFVNGTAPWLYLYDSPWFEYDPPEWVAPFGQATEAHREWWRPWAKCG